MPGNVIMYSRGIHSQNNPLSVFLPALNKDDHFVSQRFGTKHLVNKEGMSVVLLFYFNFPNLNASCMRSNDSNIALYERKNALSMTFRD